MRGPLFWLPFGLLAAALGLSLYQISQPVYCSGVPRLISIWFVGAPSLLLASLLVAGDFTRDERMQGRRPWAWLLVVWLVVAAVYGFSYYRQLSCLA